MDRFSAGSKVVFFTGAGISAESGIATFRDPEGHWSKYDPMKLASPQGFREDPELVLDWYAARRKAIQNAEPHPGHLTITHFQKLFPDSMVITQNVDGLHARAGNNPVWELHGNIHREKCFTCGKEGRTPVESDGIKHCECGGIMRPDVVWFGESLPLGLIEKSLVSVAACDILFSIGTSTQIYPAAQLPFQAQEHGAYTIEINTERTPFSDHADLMIEDTAGNALPKLFEEFYAAFS